MDFKKSTLRAYFLLFLLISFSFIKAADELPDESTYCATWSSSQYLTEANNLPPMSLSNNSIRQIVHVSVSSSIIRLKFSNRLGDSNLELKAVSIADSASQGSGEIILSTLTPVTFEGKENVIIPAATEIYSDPIKYDLKDQSEVSISTYFGQVPQKITSHAGSRTFSFIEQGNKINEQKFSDKVKTAHWYFISAIEASNSPAKKAVVCYGDSITDGRGSTDDKQNRWTDVLAKKLYSNEKTKDVAVVNAGIGATFVRNEGQERFERDVLDIKGCTYIIVLYGINDIMFNDATTQQIIEAYKILISKAHKANKFIFGTTILPFGKYSNWNEKREKVRTEVNEWIRNAGNDEEGFDAYFDFDKVTKDPNNEINLYRPYDSVDGLHPSPDGYVKMVEAIDNLDLFTVEPKFVETEKVKGDIEEEDKKEEEDEKEEKTGEIVDKIGIKFELDFELKEGKEVSITVKGKSNGSYGFRLLTTDDDGKKTSAYFYTGLIQKGDFEIETKLTVKEKSNYIVMRRPISTINLDKLTLDSIEVEADSNNQKFSFKDGKMIE